MKIYYEKPVEVNNELKLNFDEQQDGIKNSKEQCIKMIKIQISKWQVLEFLYKNESLCVPCDQTYAVTIWLRKHIMEGHIILCKPPFPL